MHTRDLHDLIGGALMAAAGVFFAVYGQRYSFGETARMGPGYFPVVLGWMLAGLGAVVALQAWWRQGTPVVVQWRNLIWSIASLLVFAFGLQTLGVVAASFAAALLALVPAALPLRTRLIVSTVVTLLTVLIFVVGLGMLLPLWPWSL